ncbi:MAG: AAA family ATPase [Verrucomicrobiales bacterium]
MSFTITIPVYSERVESPERAPVYVVWPLFAADAVAHNAREDRALSSLQRELQNALNAKAKGLDHRDIAQLSFCPPLTSRRVPLNLSLRKRTIRGDFFLVSFPALERRIVICPRIPGLSFELLRGQDLSTRATEVIIAHFRELEKDGAEISPQSFLAHRHVRVTEMELTVRVNQRFVLPTDRQMAMLGESQKMSGAEELGRTSRCLNRLYPNDLQRAILREPVLDELARHFKKRRGNSQIPKPLVLVGPSQTGKTAIVHEYLRRLLEKESGSRREHWHLNPQRLISGMSFVGQWEERVLAILKEAESRRHVLFFDDLLGLFQEGKSRDSDLTIGHVIKGFLEDGRVQMLAEATPESWRKLREVDRGFADYFRVIHVREPADSDTLRILIRSMQELESEYTCEIAPPVLPLILQLQRRFVRTRSFPGKAVDMLRQLAASHADRTIRTSDVYAHFENKTGIRQQFLSTANVFEPSAVRSFFQSRIVGQEAAVDAMVDAVATCVAQVNDATRPLTSLLFLGPTGVGKTECAKALAEYFFGDAKRLIRFDMNEFVAGDAVARLVGTFSRPRGLLTSVVRRQPYAVILLDEIEKADPAVFDLLLQVLGDGRLTDAVGQTADFCNCIVVLTSNLGARSARQKLGFGASSMDDGSIYTEAAQKFFRPELFNRLDRVIAFHSLRKEHLHGMVEVLVNRALGRQGIASRRLNLEQSPELPEALVTLGFDPEFGARPLRRAIETHLIEPLAIQMGDLPANEPATVRLSVDEQGALSFSTSRFVEAPRVSNRLRVPNPDIATEMADQCNAFIRRADAQLESWLDDVGGDSLTEGHLHYYRMREEMIHLRKVRDALVATAEQAANLRRNTRAASPSRFGKSTTRLELPQELEGTVLTSFYQHQEPGAYLKQLAQDAVLVPELAYQAGEMVHRASRIEFLMAPQCQRMDRVFVRLYDTSNSMNQAGQPDLVTVTYPVWHMFHAYQMGYLRWFSSAPNVEGTLMIRNAKSGNIDRHGIDSDHLKREVEWFDKSLIYGEGPALAAQLEFERGVQLFCDESGTIVHCGIEVFPLRDAESLDEAFERISALPRQPLACEIPITRLHHTNGFLLDLQTGSITHDANVPLWQLINPLFPLAQEFTAYRRD